MIKVLIADKLSRRIVELLEEIPEFEIDEKHDLNPDELKKEIKNYDAVIIKNAARLTAEIQEEAQNLKIIVKAGIGLDNVDTNFARTKNIEVRITPFAAAITVAEYTLAQMLSICRYLTPAYKSMKEHKWEKNIFSRGTEIYGKTAGIIGFDRIGQELAKRESAMGMNVLYYDSAAIENDSAARQVSLDELLSTADFISIHLPLTETTRNFISTAEFAKMKEGVVLIDVSDNGIIDEAALSAALTGNRIKAIALDVYEKEPPMNFELIDHEKVFPTPHLSASTAECQERAGLDVISILKDFFNV